MVRHSPAHARVRIFVDYSNFKVNWKRITKADPHENMKWDELPSVVMAALDDMEHLHDVEKEMRAIKVYASVIPFEDEAVSKIDAKALKAERDLKIWLRSDLDQLAGYTVDISTRARVPVYCESCETTDVHFLEQGVDTKIAIDLLALATRDLYDIAVLVTDDSDLVPSTQAVQNLLDKHVVHLGFQGQDCKLRACAWGHLHFDDLLPSLLRSRPKRLASAPA